MSVVETASEDVASDLMDSKGVVSVSLLDDESDYMNSIDAEVKCLLVAEDKTVLRDIELEKGVISVRQIDDVSAAFSDDLNYIPDAKHDHEAGFILSDSPYSEYKPSDPNFVLLDASDEVSGSKPMIRGKVNYEKMHDNKFSEGDAVDDINTTSEIAESVPTSVAAVLAAADRDAVSELAEDKGVFSASILDDKCMMSDLEHDQGAISDVIVSNEMVSDVLDSNAVISVVVAEDKSVLEEVSDDKRVLSLSGIKNKTLITDLADEYG